MSKIKFTIVDEHTFCYEDPRQPNLGWILMAKPQLGATQSWQDGPLLLSGRKQRPATLADCEKFRINIAPYAKEPARYDVPTT